MPKTPRLSKERMKEFFRNRYPEKIFFSTAISYIILYFLLYFISAINL